MGVAQSRRQPNQFARALFDGLPDHYDRQAELLSMGQNGRWRRAMVDAVVAASPKSVLDVATGPGGVAMQLAARSPAHVTAVDLTPEMLRAAATNLASAGQSGRVALVQARGEQLPFADATFDGLTFTYLLRYVADPRAAIRELARVVKPGGTMASLEFYVPPHPAWRTSWLLYTRLVLPTAGWLTGGREWFDVGRFLGPSISAHYRRYPLEWHLAVWREAGLDDVRARPMTLGGGLVMSGRKI